MMDPATAARMIAERLGANTVEREWIEWLIQLAMPRLGDADPTPRVRTRTDWPCSEPGKPVK
jgi:hypothetical protein